MKEYLLTIYQPEGEPPAPDVLQKIMRDVNQLREELQAAGAWVFAGGLHPPRAATVVRFRNGKAIFTDGPFAETKEHVGGFNVILAPDLNAALQWAEKLARATTLPIEVRAFRGMSDAA